MIEVILQLCDGKYLPDVVAQMSSHGLTESDQHKDILFNILVGLSTWMQIVPELVRYLIEYFPEDPWCIRVKKLDIEVSRFEMCFHPSPIQVVSQESRISRYARPPVI